jgi:hypothetical protein
MMLRLHGAEVYDQWVNHEIPFDGPESTEALDAAGEYLKNDDYVNGGLGDVRSIATTTFQDGGLPILQGACSFHRQASFYAANWPEGTEVAEDGDVFAFYLPGQTEDDKPVLGGGEFVLAFSDEPAVQAFQTYLSSDTWANNKADTTPQGGWVTANTASTSRSSPARSTSSRWRPSRTRTRSSASTARPDAGRDRLERVLDPGHQLDHRSEHRGHRGQHREGLARLLIEEPVRQHG